MITPSIIPAIDILNGELVRLSQGQYDHVETYPKTPQEMAKVYEHYGIQRLHIVDLDGAKDGQLINAGILKDIRRIYSGRIEFGGGIRTIQTVQNILDLGIDYAILGSLLVNSFDEATTIISSFPNQIIAGIDAKNGYVATEGWIESSPLTAIDLAKRLSEHPIESIIFTDIAKDGMMAGPNLEALRLMANESTHPIIASGGIRDAKDIESVIEIPNITACIIGKALLAGHLSLDSLWTT